MTDSGKSPEALALLLDTVLDDAGRVDPVLLAELAARLASNGLGMGEIQEAVASLAYLDEVEKQRTSAPEDLVAAVIAAAIPSAEIVPFRARRPPPPAETFQLLAAASPTDHQAILCRSQSGLWTLEVFVEKVGQQGQAESGSLLLAVHPDHRETYEGRTARVFVILDGEERVLAEAPIRNGELFAPVSLDGLDLWSRDAINIVFGPSP